MEKRSHKVTEWRIEQAVKLQHEGMTHAKIAETLGVSKSYVSMLLQGNIRNKRFHAWDLKEYKYPAIAKWANENQITKRVMTDSLGYSASPSSQRIVSNKLKKGLFTKEEIDILMLMTGMSYEELFREVI